MYVCMVQMYTLVFVFLSVSVCRLHACTCISARLYVPESECWWVGLYVCVCMCVCSCGWVGG